MNYIFVAALIGTALVAFVAGWFGRDQWDMWQWDRRMRVALKRRYGQQGSNKNHD